jgi:hypothetical protein
MKPMKEPSTTTLRLERKKINDSINENGEYTDSDITIKRWEGNSSQGNYLAEIAKDDSQFVGILNNRLEKEGYGFYRFPNNDNYFGSFKYDERNYNGFYIWPQEEVNGKIHTESYHGFWKDNKKFKYGIYLWLDEDEDNEKFDNANFDAYVGQFEGNNYKRGTFLKKSGDNYYVYHGDFTPDGKKNDNNAFFYSSSLDRLFHGKIENDIFKNGYIVYFNSDSGLIENIVYCDFEDNKDVKTMKMKDEINKDDLKAEEDETLLFRNVILSIDYFGIIYKTYKGTVKFMIEEMGEVSIFEDKEKFPNLMKTAVAYNKNNIYFDIEGKALGKRIN